MASKGVQTVVTADRYLSQLTCHYRVYNLLQDQKELAIKSLDVTADCILRHIISFSTCIPIYISPGAHIGLTVPSMNSKQFAKGVPASCTASAIIEVWVVITIAD